MKLHFNENIACESCAKGKISVKQFPKASENGAKEILGLVHTDICGPINRKSNGGARYCVTFIDDKSRYVTVYFMKTRDEVFEKFKEYKSFVENQTVKK